MGKIFIVEDFLLGKNKDIKKCEDGFISTDDYVAMIDGATSPKSIQFANGDSGGRYLMELIKNIILITPKYLRAKPFIDFVSKKILDHYTENGLKDRLIEHPNNRPTASMAIFSRHHQEIWFFGDCRAKIDREQFNNEKYIDLITSSCRKLYIEYQLKSGRTIAELKQDTKGTELAWPLIEIQRQFQNDNGDSIFSYGAVDGGDFPENQIKIVSVPEDAEFVTLTTDGYTLIGDSLEETESILQHQLKIDPLGINELQGFRSVTDDLNSVDDRAYIRFRP